MVLSRVERIADGLWRQLRPWVIEVLDAAISEPEPASDEEQVIADRAAKQLERYRAKNRPTSSRRRNAKP